MMIWTGCHHECGTPPHQWGEGWGEGVIPIGVAMSRLTERGVPLTLIPLPMGEGGTGGNLNAQMSVGPHGGKAQSAPPSRERHHG